MLIGLVACGVVLWVGQAFALSRMMNRRGFHPVRWFVAPLLIGPACWLLTLLKAFSSPPVPKLVRRGSRRTTALGIFELFVVLESDEMPAQVSAHATRLMPYCGRLVFARVIKAGGPAVIEEDAERFLHRIARDVGSDDVELQIMFGNMQQAVQTIHEECDFNLVLRSDQPDELFDAIGGMNRMTSLRDAMPA
jgi:hypothetical protein